LTDNSTDATTCTDWGDYWNYYKNGSNKASPHSSSDSKASFKLDDSAWDGHTLMDRTHSGPSFFLHLRSVLAVAKTLRIGGADAIWAWYEKEMATDLMPYYKGSKGQARFSIDPVLVAPQDSGPRVS